MNNKTILIIIAVVVVLGAALFFAFGNGNQEMASISNPQNSTASTSQQIADFNAQQNAQAQNENNTVTQVNRVTLAETPTGNFAVVSDAYLTKPGFIAFYKINSNGESSVIGESDLLNVGAHTNIKVQLATPVADKQGIVAVLHEDDGDGKFEYPESDGYLVNSDMRLVSDIDIVEVTNSDVEGRVIEAQVATFLENNFKTGTSSN